VSPDVAPLIQSSLREVLQKVATCVLYRVTQRLVVGVGDDQQLLAVGVLDGHRHNLEHRSGRSVAVW
jgi:hypothetical protein